MILLSRIYLHPKRRRLMQVRSGNKSNPFSGGLVLYSSNGRSDCRTASVVSAGSYAVDSVYSRHYSFPGADQPNVQANALLLNKVQPDSKAVGAS